MEQSLSDLYRVTHAYVLDQFQTSRLTYQEIADGAGMSKRTVEKIAREEIEEPSVENVEMLAAFFRNRQQVGAQA